MQVLDAALIVILASFFFVMAADFISGLVDLFNSQSLSLEDAVPELQPHIESCIESSVEDCKILPDPWTLSTEVVAAIAPTATATTAAPCLRLLPPAKPQIITLEPVEAEILASFMPVAATTAKRGRPRKEVAPAPAAAPKRRGRPRKTA
jgi:hypothetical protein